jgi:DNA-binding transcriptional ArsR family regulator
MEGVARIAAMFSHPNRSAIVEELIDGRSLPATTLAERIGASGSATSNHLRVLLDAELLEVECLGRQRLYRLSSSEVADAYEALARIAPPPRPNSLKAVTKMSQLREGRSCYDHLAGRLGVSITGALEDRGWIVPDGGSYAVGDLDAWMSLGIDPGAGPRNRPLAWHCLDWTERQNHLAGYLGKALFNRLLERHWVERRADNRAVRLTDRGRAQLDEILDLSKQEQRKEK